MLTDDQVRRLVASDPSDAEARAMLRDRVQRQIIRAIPSKTGRCCAYHNVRLDDKGTYSSGYWWHTGDGTVCTHTLSHIDPPTPYQARMRALLESLG